MSRNRDNWLVLSGTGRKDVEMNGNAFHKPEDDRQYIVARATVGTPTLFSQILFGYDEARKDATIKAKSTGKRYLIFELAAAVEVKTEWEYFGEEK